MAKQLKKPSGLIAMGEMRWMMEQIDEIRKILTSFGGLFVYEHSQNDDGFPGTETFRLKENLVLITKNKISQADADDKMVQLFYDERKEAPFVSPR